MTGKPTHESGNMGNLPPELDAQLAEYRANGHLIDSGHDSIKSGLAMLEDVGRKGRLEPLQLPEPLRFAVVPPTTNNLYVEVWRRSRPLDQPNWVVLEKPEDLKPHVLWTRAVPRRPVFIGVIQEIDYDSPDKDHWVYNNENRTARAGVFKGVSLIVRTVTEVEALYIKE